MKRYMKGTVISLFAVILAFTASNVFTAGATIYVPDDYSTIQEAIDAAITGDTVMVRDGTYLLAAALDFIGKAITVKSENGVDSCILDGQAAHSVVSFHSGEGNNSLLQGFTIRNGKAQMGGGIYIDSSSPTITECNISANTAYHHPATAVTAYAYGGGIYSIGSSPKIRDCKITGNQSDSFGGWSGVYGRYPAISYGAGIYTNGGSPEITDCIIDGNTAVISERHSAYGGGIYSTASSPSLINTTITNNSVASVSDISQGGGFYSVTGSPLMINCIIASNSAKEGGGVYFNQSSAFSNLTNNTIARNTATTNGGGLYCNNTSPKIINSILWEDSPQEVYNEGTSNPTITYSDVYGGYEGTGNIDASPLFANLAQQNFHLKLASPCVNAGSNAASELPLTDKDGHIRIFNLVVDMGAFENQAPALTVFRPAEGVWYGLLGGDPPSYTVIPWGIVTDKPVLGDYDGDGTSDVGVWRPDTGVWYVLPSSSPGIYTDTQWGVATDKPVPGDYDGDGKTDIAVWRPSEGVWYIIPSSASGSYTSTYWGTTGDVPIPADYDGDGKTDVGIWRPGSGSWFIVPSSDPGTYSETNWGIATDIPVPGDYDGDGKTDIAVWRPSDGFWYILPSSEPGTFTSTKWGASGDFQVAADYDADGKTDIAVWRPSMGQWFVLPSTAPGSYESTKWGVTTDIPISPLTTILNSIP
jgi:hypothetical protein